MSGKSALVIITDGTEEMEAVIAINVLRRANVAVTVALLGGSGGAATCSRAVKVVGDSTLTEALASGVAYDVLVLPGGLTGAQAFAKDTTVQEAVKKQYASGRLLAAICASPAIALPPCGVGEGKRVTCYPALAQHLGDKYTYVKEDKVVLDGNLLTSQGPGTAFDFALAIVKEVVGAAKEAEVRGAMLL